MDLLTYLLENPAGDLFSYLLSKNSSKKKKTISGIPPLTLLNSAGKNLLDYKIYGNSKQDTTTGYQLLNPNFTTQEVNGITYTNNSDGSVTINGTATSVSIIKLNTTAIEFSSGIIYYVSGGYSDNIRIDIRDINLGVLGSNSTGPTIIGSYTPSTDQQLYICIRVASGTTVSNLTLKPMLSKVNTYVWEPYTGGIASPNPDYPQEISVVKGTIALNHTGKNLANISSKSDYNYSSTLENGVLNINGTSTSAGNIVANLNNNNLILEANKTYIVNVYMEGTVTGSGYKAIYMAGNSLGSLKSNSTIKYNYTPTQDTNIKNITFDLSANCVFTNYKVKIMISIDGGDYEPYHEPVTTLIHIDKPLYKVGNSADYLSYINHKRFNKTNKIILNGTESIYEGSTYYVLPYTLIPQKPKVNSVLMSNYFTNTSESGQGGIWAGSTGIAFNKNGMPSSVTTLAEFKTWLSTHNTDIIYELETSTEESINLPVVPTFEGTTIIDLESNIEPSNMSVRYKTTGETNNNLLGSPLLGSSINNDEIATISEEEPTEEEIVDNGI